MFSGLQIIRLETYCFHFEKFLKNACNQILSLNKSPKSLENQDFEVWNNLLRKSLKYLRKFNIIVNKLGYKYNKQPWLGLVFNDLMLEVLFFTEDFELFLEICNTLTLFVKEEGISPNFFRISQKTKEKITMLFTFFLQKGRNPKLNKFYHYLTMEDPIFNKLRNDIEEKYLKSKPEKSDIEVEDLETLETFKKFFGETNEGFEAFLEKSHIYLEIVEKAQDFNQKQDLINLFFELKLRKFKKKDPKRFPLMISLVFFNIHQLYIKWSDIYQIYKENKPEFFSTNAYKDGLLIFLASSNEILNKDKRLLRYFLDFLANFPSNSFKLVENYINISEFLDDLAEAFFASGLEKFSPPKYYIPVLKKFRTIIINEIVNMNPMKSKVFFDSTFKTIFDKVIENPISDEIPNINVLLEYMTIHMMSGFEESPMAKECLEKIESFYRKVLNEMLEKGESFFRKDQNLSLLYQNLLGIIIFAYNHSKPSFFEDLLYNFKLISRFVEKLRTISNNSSLFIYFSHTILNNSLLNIFKKINANEFINNWDSIEVQAFMNMFQRLTIDANLVIYRGVFINYGTLLSKHVFNNYNSLEKIKETPEILEKVHLFIKIYLKDFILWTVNGYNDYPAFPIYLRFAFKEKFIEFLREIKEIGLKDQETIQLAIRKSYDYENLEKIPCYYKALSHFMAYKSREVLIAINRMREHLILDPENEAFYGEEDIRTFIEANLAFMNPFSYNTSKLITANYAKEWFYVKDNIKNSQLSVFIEVLAKEMPKIKNNLEVFFEKLKKTNSFFIKVMNSDRNLFSGNNSVDFYQDYQRANHMLSLLTETKDFELISIIISDLNKNELLLSYYEMALRGFLTKLDENQENSLYQNFETVFSGFFEIYQFLSEKIAEETAKFLKKSLEKIKKKIEEDPEKSKGKYQAFQSFIQSKVLGKKYMRKVFKKIELFNYISSFLKHLFIFAKNKAGKNIKPKLLDLVLLYFSQVKRALLEKLKPHIMETSKQIEEKAQEINEIPEKIIHEKIIHEEIIHEEKPQKDQDFIWYFIKVAFAFSEMFRLSNHLASLAENYKGSNFLSENSEFFVVLTALFKKILEILKKNELVSKPEIEAEKKVEIEGFEDYFSLVFSKYFHCNLFNEFLFPSLQTELLNVKENITMENRLYIEKMSSIFDFIRQYSQIWLLLNRNEESIPDSLQKNYEKFYTKDPLKVANYISYGNKVIEFFLHLIYESKIRIKSNHIFLIIHTKLRAIPNSHKEKSVYVAFFARILDSHIKSIYKDYDISCSRRLFQISIENSEKIVELGLNFQLPSLESLDPIYSICLQALHINLIARLIQNTNDKDPNIPKGIELIFDNWDAKFEYVLYVNKAFNHILHNKILNDDHYAVFDETVFRAKEFLIYLTNNLKESEASKVLKTLDLCLDFLANYLNIPVAREKFGAQFVRLFNENKLDFSCILLCLGQLNKFDEKIRNQGIEKILAFFNELKKLDYLNIENYRDFYNLQGLYVFLTFERILWTTGKPDFQEKNMGFFMKMTFFDKENRKLKENLSFEEFSNKLSLVFQSLGNIAYLTMFSLCEIKENGVFLRKSEVLYGNFEDFEITEIQEKTLSFLLESFIESCDNYLEKTRNLSDIIDKELRKTMKKNERFQLMNSFFLLQILGRILKQIPIFSRFLMDFKLKSSEKTFFDYLCEISPYLNNAVFSLFETIFEFQTLETDFSADLKRKLLRKTLKSLDFYADNEILFKDPAGIYHLYNILALLLLIFKGKHEDYYQEVYKKTLDCCFRILEKAEKPEDFTVLNNMNVFFAIIYQCLKKNQEALFESVVQKQYKYDKEAIK